MERKPIQVYLSDMERTLLDRLASEQGVPRAEILRRGIRAFAVQHAGGRSPMLSLAHDLTGTDWPPDPHHPGLPEPLQYRIPGAE
jgi:hypothetical protein